MPTMRQQLEQARLQKSSLRDIMHQQKQQSSAQSLSTKSKGGTAVTLMEMSEELTASTETDDVVHFSNLALVQESFCLEGAYPLEAETEAAQKPDETRQQRKEKVVTTALPPKRPRKPSDQPLMVRFSDDTTMIPPPKHKEGKDSEIPRFEDIWWTIEELACIECNARYMVRESQQYQEEVVCNVLYNKAFLTAHHLAKTMPEGELHTRLEDVGHHANSLAQWTDVGNSRRGLEFLVSDKAMINADAVRSEVFKVQREHKEGLLRGDLTAEETVETLAKAAQDASRPARIMARMMGHADAISLVAADESARQLMALPEPPEYMLDKPDYHYCSDSDDASKKNKNKKHKSLLKPLKKMFRKVFGQRKSSAAGRNNSKQLETSHHEADFRPSFLQQLEYNV